jgi:predicted PurR-regulated permease PerM
MSSADSAKVDQEFLANAMASFLQIAAVVLLLYICYQIVSPFVGIVVWAVIISVAIYPMHLGLASRLGGREKLSATIFVLIGLAIIIVPTWTLADSTIHGLKYLGTQLNSGQAEIPPPNASVAEWPLVGERLYAVWSAAATNLEATLNQFEPQLKAAGQKVVAFAGHAVGTVFQFIFSMIIAGVLLLSARGGYETTKNIFVSLAGDRGEYFTTMSIGTVRSVVKGVLGVAVIQAFLSAIGLMMIGVPAAGLWAGAVLVLAIIQLPPILILGPIALWVFSVAETVPATVFLVYALIVSASDAVLKPMFLGRGVEVPMLVILIGAIGGAVAAGIIGLFIGAVVLALGYELLTAWMAPDEQQEELVES